MEKSSSRFSTLLEQDQPAYLLDPSTTALWRLEQDAVPNEEAMKMFQGWRRSTLLAGISAVAVVASIVTAGEAYSRSAEQRHTKARMATHMKMPAASAIPPIATAATGQTFDVHVGPGFSFTPSTVSIHTGDTVKWTWDASGHTVTSGSCPAGCTPDSKFCSPTDTNCGTTNASNAGATYQHTFTQAGTYPYFCKVHGSAMQGSVVVTDAVCTPPPANLVGWWPGDGNAFDLAIGDHGVLVGGASYASGFVGQAFSLNGSTARVEVPYSTLFDPTTTGSQDAWVYFNQTPATAGHIMEIIGQGGFTADFDLQAESDNKFHFYVATGVAGNITVASATVIQPGVWYHVAATWDASGLKLYVNGVLEQFNNQATNVTRNRSGRPLWIGNQPDLQDRPFNGLIDEVEVFDRALLASEVQAIYNAASAGKCKAGCIPAPSGLISWWTAEGNAYDAKDGNSGRLQGTVNFATGEVGQAFKFAANGYVQVPYNSNLDPTAGITVDAWVGPTSLQQSALIINHRSAANDSGYTLEQHVGNDGKILWNVFVNGSSVSVISSSTLPIGFWTHIAGTFDGTVAKLYFNGVEVGSVNASGTINPSPGADLEIGRNIVNNNMFDGSIDEVQLFNRALSGTETLAMYGIGSGGQCRVGPTLRITSVSRPANQHFVGTGKCLPNALITLQAVADLNTPFSNGGTFQVSADGNGDFNFDDAGAQGQNARFYRALYP